MGIPIIGDIIGEIGKTARQLLPDPKAQAEFDLKFAELADRQAARLSAEMQGQVEINKVEAAHRSIWVAGWRPFIGWVCGAAFAYNLIVSPLFEFVARLFGWAGQMPVIDTAFLQTVLLAMLGVTAARSFDKAKGTANDMPLGKPVVQASSATVAEKPKRKRFRIRL